MGSTGVVLDPIDWYNNYIKKKNVVTFFEMYSVFCRVKKVIQILNAMRVSKLWLNLKFGVNYPFKKSYP